MKKVKLAPQERTENRRNQVMIAAESCFLKNGFHGASMAEISKKAKMSVGHIYNYFESKEAIIVALVEQEIESTIDLFKKAIEEKYSFVQVLCAYAEHQTRHKKNTKREYAALMHDIMAEVGRNPKITGAMWEYDCTLRKLLGDLCKIHHPDWEEEKIKARMEILMALLLSYKFRSAVNPDMNKEVYLDELGLLLRKFFNSDSSG